MATACNVAASTSLCVNTADVAVPAGVTDPDPLNNDATDTDEIVGFANLIFVDGFDGGTTGAWSVAVP